MHVAHQGGISRAGFRRTCTKQRDICMYIHTQYTVVYIEYMCVCACVCACVYMCVLVCVYVCESMCMYDTQCVSVFLLIHFIFA